MTALFFPDNGGGYYRHTTADVWQTTLGLPQGEYLGTVFNYSPEEYGHIGFVGLDNAKTASVKVLPLAEQPTTDTQLYGSEAVGNLTIPTETKTQLHTVSYTPEPFYTDILEHMTIVTGTDGDFVPYDERDSYFEHLVTQRFSCTPQSAIWQFKVRVYVKGIEYMYNVKGTIAGLSEGYQLIQARPSQNVCLQNLDQWQAHLTTGDYGFIESTITTFGLPSKESPVRLNLQFMLRDMNTILNFHYDVESMMAVREENQLLDLVIGSDSSSSSSITPELPYVDAKDSAGFGANVTPWDEDHSTNVDM